MSIVVFWVDGGPCGQPFGSNELSKVMAFVEAKRREGFNHVTISSEMDDHVGKPGVDSVVDGKTPDGEIYDWSKAGRAGKPRRKDLIPVVTK